MATITRHASAFTNTTGFNGNFSTPANAYSSDGQYAESTVDANPRNDEYATCWRGFDFSSIPDGSTINTVTVHMEYHVDTQWSAGTVRLSVWADVTTGQALSLGDTGNLALWTQAASSAPTSDTDWSNQMGANPTLAQLKASGFGVRVEHWQGNDANPRATSIDDLYIVVDYTAGVSTVGGSFTANAIFEKSSGTKTFTANAIFEKSSGTKTFTADAALIKSSDPAEFSLEPQGTPATRTDHDILVRARASSGTGNLLVVALYEGVTNRSGDLTQELTNTLTDYVIPISDAAAATIVDYTNLSIKFWGVAYSPTDFDVDAIGLRLPAPHSFTADAWIIAAATGGSFTANAVIEAPQSGNLTADAIQLRTFYFGSGPDPR